MISLKKIESIKRERLPFKVWDILIFGATIALTVVLTLTVFSAKGEAVIISNDGAETVYKLSENREIILDGKLTVVISGGEVYVRQSTCNNKTCEHMGKISRVNQNIVCAQNKVAIKIAGESSLAGIIGQG